MGFRFFVNRRPLPHLRRTADIVFPRIRLAVFVDGCFWHGCPDHHTVAKTNAEYWSGKVQQNQRRDDETNRILESAGWTVIRIWEHEAPELAVQMVVEQVKRARVSGV